MEVKTTVGTVVLVGAGIFLIGMTYGKVKGQNEALKKENEQLNRKKEA